MSSTKKTAESRGALADLSSQLSNAVATASASVVAIHARRRIPSSGVVWQDGVIVSASHTVRRDGEVSVTLPSGDSAQATVVGRDAATDLVVLRLSDATKSSWPSAAPRADEEAGRVGSLVLAVGRPGREVSVSFGIVSAVAEGWRSLHGTRIDRVLRLDLSVYDGFSGGPLVAASGGVVGIDNSSFARGAPTALPATEVDRVLEQILKRGHVRRPFIGVAVHPVELGSSMVREHKLERSTGLVVLSLAEGAPADAAGVLIGDVLLEASGRAIARPADLLDVLAATGEGDTLDLSLLRGGSVKKVVVTPIDRSSHREGPAE